MPFSHGCTAYTDRANQCKVIRRSSTDNFGLTFEHNLNAVCGRLCVLNGLGGFALPLQGLLFSALFGSTTFAHTTSATTSPAVQTGAKLGLGLAGAAITGALTFVGVFIGIIFIIAAYFVLRDAPRYSY